MAKLIIIRGLPGSGKSTFAKSLVEAKFADVFCEADQFFIDEHGNYKFDGMQIAEAHADCLLRVTGHLGLGRKVIVSNTFTREHELKPYIDYCKSKNIPFVSIIVENRHGNKSVHGVPDNVMAKMRDRFSFSLDGVLMSNGVMRRANRINHVDMPQRTGLFDLP